MFDLEPPSQLCRNGQARDENVGKPVNGGNAKGSQIARQNVANRPVRAVNEPSAQMWSLRLRGGFSLLKVQTDLVLSAAVSSGELDWT